MADQPKPNVAELIARFIAQRFFLPTGPTTEVVFGRVAQVISLVVVCSLVTLAAPPIVDRVAKAQLSIFPFESIRLHPTTWKRWLDFSGIAVEVLLAFFLGESLFGEWLTRRAQDTAKRLEIATREAVRRDITEVSDELALRIRDYIDSFKGTSARTVVPTLWRAFRKTQSIFKLALDGIPRANVRFIAASLGTSFPGGFFGLLAFIVFMIRIAIGVLSIYVGS
jgi:hypothetical protein